MENQTTNIEVKQAWYVTYEAIKETTAFQVQKEGSYGGEVLATFYMGDKGLWKEVGYGDYIVFTIEDAEVLKKVKIAEQLEYLKKSNANTQEKIITLQQELNG